MARVRPTGIKVKDTPALLNMVAQHGPQHIKKKYMLKYYEPVLHELKKRLSIQKATIIYFDAVPKDKLKKLLEEYKKSFQNLECEKNK